MTSLAERILDALPQTQCTRCGFADCRAYAQAIADGSAPIDQCPPGGQAGVDRLAGLTGQASRPLNPAFGLEGPRSVAVIDESWCIGCTLCVKACPTDAIVGASKFMHTVMEPYCTGCGLCLPPCPVDCIDMVALPGSATGWSAWSPEQAAQARLRYELHSRRCLQDESGQSEQIEAACALTAPESQPAPLGTQADKKRAAAQAALERARARRTAPPG